MSNNISVLLSLYSIRNEKFTSVPNNMDLSKASAETLNFQYKIDTVIRFYDNIITVKVSVRYTFNDKTAFEEGAEFDYSVINLKDALSLDNENHRVISHVSIIPTIISSAYSSLRGVVFVRTTGTVLEKFPMPLVSTEELMSKSSINVEK